MFLSYISYSKWKMIPMSLLRRGSYDATINPGLRASSEVLLRNIFIPVLIAFSNYCFFMQFLTKLDVAARVRDVLREQVAALEAVLKVVLGAKRAAARERDVLREQVAALKAKKIALGAGKVKAKLPILDMHLQMPYRDGDPKGPDPDYDYSFLFSDSTEDLVLSEKDKLDDEADED
ncbi:hypothetical protein ACOSQ4_023230 [Xanthoceras sorbifolium]